MLFIHKILTPVLLLTLLAACAEPEPVIDASSEESLMRSLDLMIAAYPEREEELRKAPSVIGHDSLLHLDYSDPEIGNAEGIREKALEDLLKRISGKTAEELIAEMERIEAGQH